MDVANLQADPRNAGCTFQVASKFNGIEGIDESTFPDSKNFTTNCILTYTHIHIHSPLKKNYFNSDIYDLTQGPVASVSAGPSAIARVYGAFYKPGTDPRLWAQTTRRQHRMLGDVSCITVANGYAMLDEMTSATLPANPYDIVNKICVGVQKGAQVTFGKCITRSDGKTMLQCVPQDIRINQVFCAALNMAQGEAGARTSNHPQAKVVERCVLRAAYEGSYLAAITAGSPRLFLTMIGGGAFGNLQSTILGEIIRAHKKYGMSSELREVVLVMYKVPENIDDICEEMRENGIPLECVIYTNGIPVS